MQQLAAWAQRQLSSSRAGLAVPPTRPVTARCAGTRSIRTNREQNRKQKRSWLARSLLPPKRGGVSRRRRREPLHGDHPASAVRLRHRVAGADARDTSKACCGRRHPPQPTKSTNTNSSPSPTLPHRRCSFLGGAHGRHASLHRPAPRRPAPLAAAHTPDSQRRSGAADGVAPHNYTAPALLCPEPIMPPVLRLHACASQLHAPQHGRARGWTPALGCNPVAPPAANPKLGLARP